MGSRLLFVVAGLLLLLVGMFIYGADRMNRDLSEHQQTLDRKDSHWRYALRPLHEGLQRPGPGDWLARHQEPGQTYEQYLASKPVRPQGDRYVIHVQPIGDFTPEEEKIVRQTSEFLGLFYNRPTRLAEPVTLDQMPEKARRKHPETGWEQLLTTYLIEEVLKPGLPADAAAFVGLTATDLWPGDGWGFVFGQAAPLDRVGVWSFHRNGDPRQSAAAYRLCLKRTLKTAVHETGHVFSLEHCIFFKCTMGGSSGQEESDRRPLWACPECAAKICFAVGSHPLTRYQKLLAFCQKLGLEEEVAFYRKSIGVLGKQPWRGPVNVEKPVED